MSTGKRMRSGSFKGPKFGKKMRTTMPRRSIVGSPVEMKYFDTVLAGTAIPASLDWTATEFDPPTFLTLCAPIQGTAINQRVGRKIAIHSVKLRGTVTVAPQATQSAADLPTVVRLIVVHDKQTNTLQAQGEQVMDGTSGTSDGCTNAFMSLANFGRFKILHDERIILQDPNLAGEVAAANVISNGIIQIWEAMIKFKTPVIVHFNATNGGTILDIVDHSFHVMATCKNAALVPQLTYVARVGYKDA